MTGVNEFDDPFDPRRRAWRRLWLKAKCVLALVGLLVLATVVCGVPHLQGNFKSRRPGSDGFTPSREKLEANYLGPTGWRTVHARETGYRGLPIVLLIPIDEVFELSWDYPFLHALDD